MWNGASHLLPGVQAHSLPALRGCPVAHSREPAGTCAICESSTCKERTEAPQRGSKDARQTIERWKHDYEHGKWEFISQRSVLSKCNLVLYQDIVKSSIKYTGSFYGCGDKSSLLSASIEMNSIDVFSLFKKY